MYLQHQKTPALWLSCVFLASAAVACGFGDDTAVPDAATLMLDGSTEADANGDATAVAAPDGGPVAADAGDATIADATIDANATAMNDAPSTDAPSAPDTSAAPDAPTASDGGAAPDAPESEAAVPTPPPDFLWYVLDETAGTTAKDSSLNRYDITNLTDVVWDAGANFNGVSGGGSVDVDPSFRVPPITISAWLTPQARADETSNDYVLVPYPTNAIGDDDPGLYGFGIGLNVWTDGDGGSAVAAEDVDTCQRAYNPSCIANEDTGDAGPFVAGDEYLVTVTVDEPGDAAAAPAVVYINGEPYDVTSADVPGTSSATTLFLGRHNDDTGYGSKRFFAGRIRDARVYKRLLGPDEVAQLYANGPTTVAPPRLDEDDGGDL
ncbi:MAG TPA: LamG-like jellyroll fold domain-containing protein [Polyangiaceae bacterium]|nr:LamG-like jellyroll fold domain-containing protein [Polyangiaceae bacterium]